jgi:hypothetical protein
VDLSEATGVIHPTLDFRISSGLARPDYFDWPAQIHNQLLGRHPAAVVAEFGANDGQNMEVNGKVLPFGSPEWVTEYRARVGAVMDDILAHAPSLFWVGLPVMRSATFDARVAQMDEIYKAEAAKRAPAAHYIDTRALLATSDGKYADYLPDASGKPHLMRQQDGVHLTRTGGDRMAAAVLDVIEDTWHIKEPGR